MVAQLGARMHYAVPRGLAARGMLEALYTDAAVPPAVRRLASAPAVARLLPAPVRRLLGRDPAGIDARRVHAFAGFGLRYAHRLRAAATNDERLLAYLWAGERFGELVAKRGFGHADAVYAFNSAALPILKAARSRGLATVLEQTVAPYEILRGLVEAERRRLPDWEAPAEPTAAERRFIEREREEWRWADAIVCGSAFVIEGVRADGGPAERCHVVPYGVDGRFGVAAREPHAPPLRVLTVGAVGLRKGSPYVLEAARRLRGRARFRMVGALDVPEAIRRRLAEHVELAGPLPNSDIVGHYAWADVFLLPSVCEGSATAVYEALRCGLPVVCTPNTGSVVRDGSCGYVVAPGDVDGIVGRLEQLAGDAALLERLSAEAAATGRRYSLERYVDDVVAVVDRLVAAGQGA